MNSSGSSRKSIPHAYFIVSLSWACNTNIPLLFCALSLFDGWVCFPSEEFRSFNARFSFSSPVLYKLWLDLSSLALYDGVYPVACCMSGPKPGL